MKAWIGTSKDAAVIYQLGDVAMPQPKAGELVVRVRAAGLNRVDQRPKASHFSHTDPAPAAIPGLEMAGEVVTSASDAFRAGDRVMAMVQGGCAEFVRVHASLAMRVPADMSWEIAASIPIPYLTAYDAVVLQGRLRRGENLLVHAVTSGVGIAAVQIGSARGAAFICGSSTSAGKLKEACARGVDFGILDPYRGFAPALMEKTCGDGVHVVVDNIGGKILNETIRATAFGGRVVDVGRLGGTTAEVDLDLLAVRRVSLIGVTFRTRTLDEHSAICRGFIADHGADLAAGRLAPVIARVFAFDDLPAAIQCAREGKLYGKVALRV